MKHKKRNKKLYSVYVKKYIKYFILAPIFMILEACGEFILPYFSAKIINIGASNNNIVYILQMGALMAVIAILMLIFGVLGAKYAINGSVRLAGDLRNDMFKKIQQFSYSNLDEFSTGSLITRITNDTSQIEKFTQTLLRSVFRSPVMMIGAIIMAFRLDSNMALSVVAIIPFLAISISLIVTISAPRYTKMQNSIDTLNLNVEESLTNEKVIKSFVQEHYQERKFRKINDNLVQKSKSALKVMLLMRPVTFLATNIATLLLVWTAGKKVMVGAVEIGTLIAFITYLSQILNALNIFANIAIQASRAKASDKRVREIFSAKIVIENDKTQNSYIENNDGKIEFSKVNFKYNQNSPSNDLENISFTVNSGDFVGIIGPTGSGKSTLVSLIPRLYDPESGEIFINDLNIKNISVKSLRKDIAIVLQKNTLFSGTIAENLRWGNETATLEQMREACKIACIDDFISSYPDGYDQFIEQGGKNLSGGQKQRICIARAILKNPKILILDDSTSAVDTITDASIRRYLKESMSGVTKIIITQRISSIIDADKILVLNNGKIVGMGDHKKLINSCSIYKEIYDLQNNNIEKTDENTISENNKNEKNIQKKNKISKKLKDLQITKSTKTVKNRRNKDGK